MKVAAKMLNVTDIIPAALEGTKKPASSFDALRNKIGNSYYINVTGRYFFLV